MTRTRIRIRDRSVFLVAAVLALLVAPLGAEAQTYAFDDLVELFLDILDDVIVLIVALAVVMFIWGVLKYITAGESEDKIREGRNYIIYGIIGIFVMVSVWGLVNILVNTLDLDTTNLVIPTLPRPSL